MLCCRLPPLSSSAFTCLWPSRDVHKVDPSFLTSTEPCLIVRKHSILLNACEVKAVILYDKMFLILTPGSEGLLQLVESKLVGNGNTSDSELGDSEPHQDFKKSKKSKDKDKDRESVLRLLPHLLILEVFFLLLFEPRL